MPQKVESERTETKAQVVKLLRQAQYAEAVEVTR
jgi:hypothetical protein